MKALKASEISKAAGGEIIKGDKEAIASGVSTDTRTIKSGDIFFALIGENSDGHKYLNKAYENGCRMAVISDRKTELEGLEGMTVIAVEDTLKALQKLAKYYLTTFENLYKIGITGSTGKTSTKELLYWSLCGKYKTAKNKGNFNNHIGMPLTALSVEEGYEAAIFEMGMGNFGEVDLLADIGRPDMAIITNIGVSHIADLGSRENILKAKMEITNYFDENSKLIINFDNDLLSAIDWDEKKYKVIKVGKAEGCDYIIGEVVDHAENGIELGMTIKGGEYEFHIPIPGVHNGYNGALAVAAAVEAGVKPEEIAKTIAKCEHTDKRLVISDSKDGIKVIDDTYNASPDSMKAGIDVLMSVEGKRKFAILGDMLGMGKDTEKFHRQVGEYAAAKNLDMVISVGSDARFITGAAGEALGKDRARHYDTKEALMAELDQFVKSGDAVLIKASRAMGMEKIAEYILKDRS